MSNPSRVLHCSRRNPVAADLQASPGLPLAVPRLGPEQSDPHRSESPPLPIPTRARTSALGGYVTGNGVGLGRGAVRRSETFIIPIASCFQGTILALTPAMLPTAGSVARGH